MDTTQRDWIADCMKWRGRVLTGRYAHWCFDWDGLPIDETSNEWPCPCAAELRQDHLTQRVGVLLARFVGRTIDDATIAEMSAVLNADPEIQQLVDVIGISEPPKTRTKS